MSGMADRAVRAVRELDQRYGTEFGPDANWVACSHGDVIKAIVTDALGLHLDQCQRIQADPCSLTVVRYTPLRPFLLRMNDTGGEVAGLIRRPAGPAARRAENDGMVGGGAGPGGTAEGAREGTDRVLTTGAQG